MQALRLLTLSGVMLAGLACGPVQAACTEAVDPAGVHLEPMNQNGVAYMSGGIGIDESCAIQKEHGYSLQLTFSAGADNKYESGIKVSIQNAQGKQVLSVDDAGPMLLVQLPAGKYQVVSQLDGHEMRTPVDLSTGKHQAVNVHWKAM